MRYYEAPDGARWSVEVRTPSFSNVMIVFHHPDGRTSRLDRYAWYMWPGAEARDVTARLDREAVLARLADADLARLFRRSMPVSTEVPELVPSPPTGGNVGRR